MAYEHIHVDSSRFDYYDLELEALRRFPLDPENPDRRFLKRLFVRDDLQHSRNLQYAVEVRDFVEPYCTYLATRAAPPAEYDTSRETGQVTVVVPPPPPYQYEPRPAEDAIFDVAIHQETGETGLRLHDGFAPVKTPALYKVDLVVTGVEPVWDKELQGRLAWVDRAGFRVTSLHDSVREALTRSLVQLKGKVLFTYYIVLRS